MPRLALASMAVLLAVACATTPPPPPSADQPIEPAVFGITPEEEAVVLRLEDRREWDPAVASQWITHSNALHRKRMAVALGRIGTATFDDANGNGVRDEGERMAGVELLSGLTSDPAYPVREAAAFALGEIGDPSAVETLFEFASDPEHAGVSSAALEALSKLATHTPLARYAGWTQSEVPEGLRATATRFLFRFEDPAAAAIAASLLGDASAAVRREAAYSLSRRPFVDAADRLALLLNDPDVATRAHAARALGRISNPLLIPLLAGSLSDPHPWVRINAGQGLAQIGAQNESAFASLQPDDASAIITATRDEDASTRISLIDALGHLSRHSEAAKSRLLEIAADGSSWEREVATAAIIRQMTAGDAATVDSLLQTDSRFLRIRALEASGALPIAGASIRQRFFSNPDPAVRAAALGSIPDAGVEEAREAIESALSDPDPIVRATAIERWAAVAAIDPEEKLARLTEIARSSASDSLNDARLSAVTAIAAMEGDAHLETLRSLLDDGDPVVRRLAAEGIERAGLPRPQYTPLPVDRPLSDYVEIATWAMQPHAATLTTTRGPIEIVLLSQDAPMTTWNFAQLAQRDYFDGTTFMRVVPNFVVQGGDPRNDQSGGPGYSIRDEINLQRYTRGAVGMALSGLDTGGSQFFITHSPQPHLDGGYTVFGRVVGGMSEVVDEIQRGDVVQDVVIHNGGDAN